MEAIKTQTYSKLAVDLKHALIWVARALDYVGIDDINHNHRVAYIAYEGAKLLNWDTKKQEFCFLAGLIHDCGVSQTEEHKSLVSELVPGHAQVHCIAGYQALEDCSLLKRFSTIILHHHTNWKQLKSVEISPFEKDIAALVYVADRLDYLRAKHINIGQEDLVILHKQTIINELQEHSGQLFKPEFVDVICQLVNTDGFWFAMEPEHIESIPLQFTQLAWLQNNLTARDLIKLGRFIAGIVDAKSPFTYQHSVKVAELCRFLAKGLNLPTDTTIQLYISGLVHDIGKLRTPDKILHKPGSLSKEEFIRIKRHTIDTEIALQMVFPNSRIGEWASNHHERLDGSGYPYHKRASELDVPSRIIAVADVFQALSQDRPYRGKLTAAEILIQMQTYVDSGRLDQGIFNYLRSNIDHCYQLSTSTTGNSKAAV